MIFLAAVALALVVIALLGRGVSSEQIVTRLSRERDPRVVAAAAAVLESRGMRLTAEALRARAQGVAGGATTSGESAAPLRAPLAGVSDEAWMRFVRALAGPRGDACTPGGRLGRFGMHLRRLEELRVVRNVRKGEDGALVAEWAPPLTQEVFLRDPRVQYRALVASMKGLRGALDSDGTRLSGRTVDGQPASLSGLLAVAHRLGMAGLGAWLESAAERQRQRIATELFRRTNGLF